MTSLRGFRLLLLAASLLAVLAFCMADARPGLGLLALAAAAGSAWLTRREPVPVVPRVYLNVLVIGAIAHLVLRLLAAPGAEVISNLAQFLCLVVLIKMFDRSSMRDEAYLLGISVFVVIGAVLTGSQLALGLLLILYTPLAIAGVILWQLHSGHERRARRLPAAAGGPVPQPAVTPRSRGPLLATVVSAIALCFATAVLAFIVTPRNLVGGALGQWGGANSDSTTGFASEIKLGNAGLISTDESPVMDVVVTDSTGADPGLAGSSLYLRGAVLTRYNPVTQSWYGGTDANPAQLERTINLTPGEPSSLLFPRGSTVGLRARLTQQITIRSAADRTPLFAALRPVELSIPRGSSITLLEEDGLLIRNGPANTRLTYTVVSAPDFTEPDFFEPDPGELPADPAPEPPFDFAGTRIQALARELLARAEVPESVALREPFHIRRAAQQMVAHLQATCTYTLEPTIVAQEGVEPLEVFLFENQRGHCEYFASAMVAMCQSVGIPARIATGYVGGEYNPIARHYVIRQSDAHAWVELRTHANRWETFDPTPPSALQHVQRSSGGLLSRARQFWEALEFSWVQNVVSFDQSSGRPPLTGAWATRRDTSSAPLAEVRKRIKSLSDAVGGWLPEGTFGRTVSAFITFILIGGVAYAAWRLLRWTTARLRRLLSFREPGEDSLPPDLLARIQFYLRASEMLARAGLPRPRSMPPLRHARSLPQDDPRLAAAVAALAERYYAVRYGQQPLSPEQEGDIRARLTELAALLQARAAVR